MRFFVRYHYSGGAVGPTVFAQMNDAVSFLSQYTFSSDEDKNPLYASIEDTVTGEVKNILLFTPSHLLPWWKRPNEIKLRRVVRFTA